MHPVLDCRSIHRHLGGIGRAAWGLAAALGGAPRGHRITALIGSAPPEGFAIEGVEIVGVDAAMIDEPFEQLGLPGVLEDLGVDVYLNTTFSVPALKTTRSQVAIIHDVVFEDKPEWVEPGLRRYLQRWSRFSATHADRIIAVSDHARKRIIDAYRVDPAKVVRIYNGISSSCFESPPVGAKVRLRQKFGIRNDYILCLGTLEPKKGVPELLEAFARFVRRPGGHGGPPLLVLAGGKGGPEWDLDAAVGRTGCADRVVCLGYVSEEDKKDLLSTCSLFVYPSHYEGFGFPPLEAMALGIPTLVNDATSLPEIVGDAALKVDVRDAEAFAGAIDRGLNDQELRNRLREAGPQRAREFTWERAAGQVLDLCESLVK